MSVRRARSTSYTMLKATIEVSDDDVHCRNNGTPRPDAKDGEQQKIEGPKLNGVENSKLADTDRKVKRKVRRRRRRTCTSPKENVMEQCKLDSEGGSEEDANDYEWQKKQHVVLERTERHGRTSITILTENGTVEVITLSSGYHKDLDARLQAGDLQDKKNKIKAECKNIIHKLMMIL